MRGGEGGQPGAARVNEGSVSVARGAAVRAAELRQLAGEGQGAAASGREGQLACGGGGPRLDGEGKGSTRDGEGSDNEVGRRDSHTLETCGPQWAHPIKLAPNKRQL